MLIATLFLEPVVTPTWAADDTDSAKALQTDEPADTEEAEEKPPTFDRAELMKLIGEKKLDEASERLAAARAEHPDDSQLMILDYTLTSFLQRSDPKAARSRLERLHGEFQKASEEHAVLKNYVLIVSQSYATSLASDGMVDEALKVLDDAIVSAERASGPPSPMTASLEMTRVRVLTDAGRGEEALKMTDARFDATIEEAAQEPAALNRLVALLSLYQGPMTDGNPELLATRQRQVEETVVAMLESEDAGLNEIQAYHALQMARASRLLSRNPEEAGEIANELMERMEPFVDKLEVPQSNTLERLKQRTAGFLSQVESAMERRALIGQEAPELDSETFVNSDVVKLADLRGKVVLIDFWAVWCGPCIATFPHLRHLHEEFSDDGLVILGVTRKYGYKWDEEANEAVSNKEATLEEELVALEGFRKKHELPYGFVVTPAGSTFAQQFKVSGIPQAVVIDQEGVIREISVGSGEASAQAIEAAIKKLLDRDEA
jgi:thiol-disulfide isomerase/thioredoxin